MFSIIVCSINPQYLANLTSNIAGTIEAPYELLVADNRGTGKGICQVYNELAEQARYPYLLFVHEDVVFRKKNWGPGLLQIFENNPGTGAVGIAGSNYKSRMLSGWYTGFDENDAYNIVHITHGRPNPLEHYRPQRQSLYDAITLDGVFIASTRENWQQVRFNDSLLKGFHFYDLDFSIRTWLHGQKVWIWMDLELEHLTVGGDFGTAWMREAFVFHDYLDTQLPVPGPADARKELAIANTWLDYLKIYRIKFSLKWQWISRQQLWKYPSAYYNLLKFLFYQPLGLRAVHNWFRKNKPHAAS